MIHTCIYKRKRELFSVIFLTDILFTTLLLRSRIKKCTMHDVTHDEKSVRNVVKNIGFV